jgi:hypothetical protein
MIEVAKINQGGASLASLGQPFHHSTERKRTITVGHITSKILWEELRQKTTATLTIQVVHTKICQKESSQTILHHNPK